MPSGGNFTNCNCGAGDMACENPTQPVSTVGLCLSDGTPIAVTVVRDCAGTVTSEGWIDLTTGTYSAGPPPAGAIACGDSRSITVAGTFCDVADDGSVLGLVLVEYSYNADGSINAVRLVDAVTGDTYAPQGEVTTCPAGVEQPERDMVQLCDVADDESGAILAVPFLRDYGRDENGLITGHTDYTLDGQPYTPAGTVGVCPIESPCQHCETLTLCDFVPDEEPGDPEIVYEAIPLAELPPAGPYGDGSPVTGTLPNGVEYSVNVGEWLGPQGHYTYYPYDGTQLWTFDQPVYLRFGLRGLNISPTECYILPEGAAVETISPAHTWDPDTRRLCGPSGSSAVDESVFLLGPVTELPIVPSGSSTGGRGPGLIEVGLPVEDDTPPAGTSVPFLRTVCRDCAGTVTSTTDTALDGETPYAPVGDVTTCGAAAGAGGGASPTIRVDVETEVLCIRDEAGDITGQVVAARIYNGQSGDLIGQRLTDPTTGEPVELPAGSELVVCQEPPCPVAFATECVGAVTRTEAAYDNTSMIGGVPGKCGSVQGPNGQFPCQPTTGPLTITSWIVDGEEVIGEGGGRSFNGGPCGAGTAASPGMHRNWAAALTNLDPSGATWAADEAEGCAWFVGSTGGTQTVYGAMTVEDAAGQQWILGPAQACEEIQYTKVYSQDCDGSVSVSWLDAQGVETDAPEGDLVPCGTGCGGGGGSGLDVEVVQLCDLVDGADPVPFLRHLAYLPGATAPTALDTELDGVTPYVLSGAAGACSTPCDVQAVLEACRCDDTDGDGVGDTEYAELLGVDCDGVLTSLGTYLTDLSAPYTPVAPVPCDEGAEGAEPVTTIQAHRVQLAPGASWSAGSVPTLQSVTLAAHNGTGTITTSAGESTLFDGESVTWSVVRDDDALLVGPLAVAVNSGFVTVTYTRSATA